MKLRILPIACTAALAALAGQAAAQTPLPFSTPDATVTLSGATAPDNFILAIATQLYEPGFHRYQDNNGTVADFTDDGRLFNAVYGRIKSTADIPAALRGRNILFIKRSKGGSVWGVNPVARAQRIARLDINAATCVLNAGIYRCNEVGIDPGLPGYLNAANAGLPSDFGVSDVEPAMFKAPYNVEFGQDQLSGAETARLSVFPVNTLMMGIVATNSVPATTYLSISDYGSMLSGAIQDWSQIDASLTTGNTQAIVCRRVPGSGTQTSYNWFFQEFPCSNAVGGAGAPARMATDSASVILGTITGSGTAADPFILNPADGYTVIENSTSGLVRDCLRRAEQGGVHEITAEDGKRWRINFGAGGYRAIGTLSLDSFAAANPNNNGWSFRALDGAGVFNANTQTLFAGPGSGKLPSVQNLRQGRYEFASELTMQYRKVNVVNQHGDSVAALTDPSNALKRAFADEFIKRAGDPAFQSVATAALPPNYTPVIDGSGTVTNAVARATRSGNTCSPLVKFF